MRKIILGILCGSFVLLTFSCKKQPTCLDYKTGTFLISKDTTFAKSQKLIRTEEYITQITEEGDTLFAKIEWLNDCSYKLFYDKDKMHLNNFQINVNRLGGLLIEFGQPSETIMPYTAVLKGETKVETFKGYLKKTE